MLAYPLLKPRASLAMAVLATVPNFSKASLRCCSLASKTMLRMKMAYGVSPSVGCGVAAEQLSTDVRAERGAENLVGDQETRKEEGGQWNGEPRMYCSHMERTLTPGCR